MKSNQETVKEKWQEIKADVKNKYDGILTVFKEKKTNLKKSSKKSIKKSKRSKAA